MNNGMIQSYIETPTQLLSNSSPIAFTTDCIRTRSANCMCSGWLQHSEGSPLYKILEGGRYKINFDAEVSSATAGVISFALFMDGVRVPGTTITETITTAGELTHVSFTKVIPICCRGDATITVQSVPNAVAVLGSAPVDTQIPTIQSGNFIIEKIA